MKPRQTSHPQQAPPIDDVMTADAYAAGFASIDDMIDAVLDAQVTGELDAARIQRLVACINKHPPKAAELAALRATVACLSEPVSTPDFAADVAREVQLSLAADPFYPRRSSGSWILPAAIAAGIVVAAAAGFLFINPARPFAPAVDVADAAPRLEKQDVVSAPGSLPPPRRTASRERSTALPMGPTDQHEIAGNWNTALRPSPPPQPDSAIDGRVATAEGTEASRTGEIPGRIVSVRVGPSWSLWWIPSKDGGPNSDGPWQILSRFASPTNATVTKPRDDAANPK